MVTVSAILMAVIIGCQRLGELVLARRNQKHMLEKGAREYGKKHYPLFFLLHGTWLAGWLAETLLLDTQPDSVWPLWFFLFCAAQALRYWCITSLGMYWNTRILVIPGQVRVTSGPYRYIPHPNYLAVGMELICVPLLFGAWITALTATVLNAMLLFGIRIPAEEQALGLKSQPKHYEIR